MNASRGTTSLFLVLLFHVFTMASVKPAAFKNIVFIVADDMGETSSEKSENLKRK